MYSNSPFGFGGGMGYMDPLGSGRRMGIGSFLSQPGPMGPGMGGPPMPPSGPAAPGGAPRQGIGGFIKGAGKWLAQPDNLAAATNLAGTAAMVYGAHQDRQDYREEMARQRKIEDEERERERGWNPQQQAIIEQMLMRRGG